MIFEAASLQELAKPLMESATKEQQAERCMDKAFDGNKTTLSETRKPLQDVAKTSDVNGSGMSEKRAEQYFSKKFDKKHYVPEKERLDHTPSETSEHGSWTGERGNSKFIPSHNTEDGRLACEKLKDYNEVGVVYRDAEPDFSPVSEATVEIESMTANRPDNFFQADTKCAEQWNAIKRENRTDWTALDVRNYRRENNLSWHECCDRKTMNLVPQEIHGLCKHSGGVAECKARDTAKTLGGVFDD